MLISEAMEEETGNGNFLQPALADNAPGMLQEGLVTAVNNEFFIGRTLTSARTRQHATAPIILM
jgi:hypothetical protein